MEKQMASVSEAISKIGDAIKEFSTASTQNTQSALSMIQKPKRIVRENGRVTRIETE
jgi:archaellum component FlaG (FlaF/FlaG flagellin family)